MEAFRQALQVAKPGVSTEKEDQACLQSSFNSMPSVAHDTAMAYEKSPA